MQPAQSLDGNYSFVTCGFGGGGFDLAGVVTKAATVGIPATAAQGSLSRIGLIDFSIIEDHEDLVGKIAIEPGVTLVTADFGGTFNPDHGTAVAGILVAADNGIGITGMAPRSSLIFFPAVSASSPQGRLASALVAAGETLQVGDVLCIPLEVGGGNTLATPTANNLLLATVQNLGVTTVLPAGNGGYSTLTPQSGLNNAILVGGVWPGYQVPPINANGTPSSPTYPVCSSYGRWRGSNYSTTVGVGGGIDVSAWATGLCTLGVGSLYRGTPAPGDSANSRAYQQSFEGTSGACAMIAGLATVLQSCAVAGVGTGVSPERMRQIMADQVYVDGVLQTDSLGNPVRFPNDPTSILQCDYFDRTQLGALPGTASNLPFAIASGDFVPFGSPSYVQANPVGGFPKAISCLRETLFTQYFPGGITFGVDIVTGVPLFGNTFSVANFDGGFLKIGASRRGRGNTGAGFGRPLVYASSGLMTDVQVRGVLPISDPEELFQLVFRAWGRTSTGAAVMSADSISGQALTLAYVYDGVANRWRYLDFGFVAAANPNLNMPSLDATVTTLGYVPSNLVVRNNNQFCTYFRLVSFAAGIPGPYEMWWDQFLISTTPLANP